MRIYIIKINVGAYLIGMRGRLPRYEVINMLLRRLDVLNVGGGVHGGEQTLFEPQ